MSTTAVVFAWIGLAVGLAILVLVVLLLDRVLTPIREIRRYGDDILGGELVLVLLVVVQSNGAPFGTDAGQHLRGLEDVVRPGVALDDRHLVIVVIAIGDRHRVGRGAAQQEPDHTNHTR